jgi:hypothetical protein
MNAIYLMRSILECVDRDLVCQQTHVNVCNLEPLPSTGTVILLLSILTSAAMLGYKAARTLASAHCCDRHTMPSPIRRLRTPLLINCLECFEPHFAAEAEILRSQRNETKELEAERSALIAELEATLSPQVVEQVQTAMQRVGSPRGNRLSSHQPSQGEVPQLDSIATIES